MERYKVIFACGGQRPDVIINEGLANIPREKDIVWLTDNCRDRFIVMAVSFHIISKTIIINLIPI